MYFGLMSGIWTVLCEKKNITSILTKALLYKSRLNHSTYMRYEMFPRQLKWAHVKYLYVIKDELFITTW